MKLPTGYPDTAASTRVSYWWNVPNILSLSRILLTPILVVILLTRLRGMEFWALGIFWLASLTDLLDGYLARRHALQTRLGAMLDTLADKILVCSVFIALVELHLVPAWMVVIFVGRELLVTGLRSIAASQTGWVISARTLGKWKFVFQVITISLVILDYRYGGALHQIALASLWIALTMTLFSMLDYLVIFARVRANSTGVSRPE